MWGAEAPTTDPVNHGPALAGGQREPPSRLLLGWGPGHPRALISQQASSFPAMSPQGRPPLSLLHLWTDGVACSGGRRYNSWGSRTTPPRRGQGPVHNAAQPWKGAAGALASPAPSAPPWSCPEQGAAASSPQSALLAPLTTLRIATTVCPLPQDSTPRAARCLHPPPRSPTWPCHPACAQLLRRRAGPHSAPITAATLGAGQVNTHARPEKGKKSRPERRGCLSCSRKPTQRRWHCGQGGAPPRRPRPACHTPRARLPEHLTSRREGPSPRVKPGHTGVRPTAGARDPRSGAGPDGRVDGL